MSDASETGGPIRSERPKPVVATVPVVVPVVAAPTEDTADDPEPKPKIHTKQTHHGKK